MLFLYCIFCLFVFAFSVFVQVKMFTGFSRGALVKLLLLSLVPALNVFVLWVAIEELLKRPFFQKCLY